MPGDQLICDGGRCKCRNPVNMWYNSNDNTCTIKLGLPCIPDHATDKCGDKTVCLEDSSLASNTGYSCQCDAGFIMGTDGSYCHKGICKCCSLNLLQTRWNSIIALILFIRTLGILCPIWMRFWDDDGRRSWLSLHQGSVSMQEYTSSNLGWC